MFSEPEHEGTTPPQQQMVLPATHIQVVPQGVLINNLLTPSLNIVTSISREDMDRLVAEWKKVNAAVREEERMKLAVMKDLKRSRND